MAQQQVQREKPQQKPDMTVGDILRKTRIHYEQSIEDIERVLHIKAAQLDAIENNDFKKLPGTVYAVGFIRTYSEYLGLDGDKMVSLFKTQSGARPVKPELTKLPSTVQDSRTPNWWLLAASVFAMLAISVLWMNGSKHDRNIVESVPAVPPGISVASAPAPKPQVAPQVTPTAAAVDTSAAGPAQPVAIAQAPATAAPVTSTTTATTTTETAAAEQAPAKQQDGVILKITQNSWVEIKDNTGKAVVSRVLKAGDKYFVPARSDLFMSLGNSGGVKLEIDGVELPNIGAPGQVMRNIPLDIASLRKQFSKTIANPAH